MFTWNLPSNGGADLCFGILEKFDEGRDQVAVDNFFIDSFGDLKIRQDVS